MYLFLVLPLKTRSDLVQLTHTHCLIACRVLWEKMVFSVLKADENSYSFTNNSTFLCKHEDEFISKSLMVNCKLGSGHPTYALPFQTNFRFPIATLPWELTEPRLI